VVADAQRARVFTLAWPEIPELEPGPELAEREDLLNPEAGTKGRELFSELKSGANRAPHGASFGYADHRPEHYAELRRRFARRIAACVLGWIDRAGAMRLVVIAEPRMLGHLRDELVTELPRGLDVRELGENLTALQVVRLRQMLERHGLFPGPARRARA
jgi:protein required for attachment to host cells